MASTQDVPPRGGSMTVAAHAPPSSPSSASAGASPAAAGGEPERAPARGLLVGVIMAGIVASTIVMVGFIWYRWSGVREPTSAVIIEGDASLDGTSITVTGGERGPEHTSLNATNGYRAAVLVPPGRYGVTAERDGVVLLRREVEVERFLAVQFNLARMAELQRHQPQPNLTPGAGAGSK